MRRWHSLLVVVSAALLWGATPGSASLPDNFNHAEVDWQEMATDHFRLVFPPSLTSTATLAASLLEEVYEPTCAALGTHPKERTTVILADFDDVGFNNFARRMQHVIYLSNPVMNQARVDREQWLRHLLAHEYVHVVNGWALNNAAAAFGDLAEWTGMDLQPQWFTEGLAEYIASRGDKSQGSFILQAAQQNELLFGGKLDIADLRYNVIETSVVYKQGEAMCQFLAEKYGENVFRRIIKQYARTPQFDLSFKVATGRQVELFAREWLQHIRERAAKRPPAAQDPVLAQTTAYRTPLEAALGGRLSPDGRRLAVYGVWDWEEPIPGLFVINTDGSGSHRIAGNLDLYDSWKFSWSKDGRYLVYAGREKVGNGAVRNAVFVYDLVADHTRQVNTKGLRVGEPEISPDGQRLAFTCYHHERAVLATMSLTGGDVKYVTRDLAQDCFSPTWSPDGRQLAFSVTDNRGTDLAVINVDGTGYQRLTNDVWPDQYPAWSPDGSTLAFVSFRQEGGAKNEAAVSAEAQGLSVASSDIYVVPAKGGKLTQLTHATSGGCYYPAWSADSKSLTFSLFQVRTATVRRLDLTKVAQAPVTPPATDLQPQPERLAALPTPPPLAAPVAVTRPRSATPDAGAQTVVPGALQRTAAATNLPPAPAATAPVAAAPPRPAAGPPGPKIRPYRGIARLEEYLVRPYRGQDGLGDTLGIRRRMADPLLQHQVLMEAEYGTGKSNKWSGQVQYLNAQTDWTVGATFFQRVPPLRGERGALVAETSNGVELLAELPVAVLSNAYSQDKFQLGFELADHRPFATSGGLLRPAPRAAKVGGPSVGFTRSELLPNIGDQQFNLKFLRSARAYGADLDYITLHGLYYGHFFLPNPQQKLGVGAALDYFNGRTFTRTNSDQLVFTGEIRFDARVVDQVLSRYTWPYFGIGPVDAVVVYQLRELVSGTGGGADTRDRAQFQFQNRGYLFRNGTYKLTAGPTFYIGGDRKTDWSAQIIVDLRSLSY